MPPSVLSYLFAEELRAGCEEEATMAMDSRGELPSHPEQGLPLHVHSCSRVGLQANPPGRRKTVGNWLRSHSRSNGGGFPAA
jgi:hypothetical protein